MSQCPCHSGLGFEACCGPYLDSRPVPTALALMRSLYTAYTPRAAAYFSRPFSLFTFPVFYPSSSYSFVLSSLFLFLFFFSFFFFFFFSFFFFFFFFFFF